MRGTDAIRPPMKVFLFAISETRTIIPEEIIILIIFCSIIPSVCFYGNNFFICTTLFFMQRSMVRCNSSPLYQYELDQTISPDR